MFLADSLGGEAAPDPGVQSQWGLSIGSAEPLLS